MRVRARVYLGALRAWLHSPASWRSERSPCGPPHSVSSRRRWWRGGSGCGGHTGTLWCARPARGRGRGRWTERERGVVCGRKERAIEMKPGHWMRGVDAFLPSPFGVRASQNDEVVLTVMRSMPACRPAERSKFPLSFTYCYLARKVNVASQ